MENYPNTKIGLTAFKKLRPVNVKIVSETSRRTYLCTTCCCLALKLEALNKFVCALQDPSDDIKKLSKMSKTELTAASLCPVQSGSHPDLKCLDRTCDTCGDKLELLLEPLQCRKDEQIKWCTWKYVTVTTKKNEKKRVLSCVEKMSTISSFIGNLKVDMGLYPAHMFRANWQHAQMRKKHCHCGVSTDCSVNGL